jgi:hypothetical protein
MARFFEAPVVKATDYSFKYPVEQIGQVLELEQKKQDEALNNALKMMEANKQDVIQTVYDVNARDAMIQQRNAEINALVYDETGNVKDLRGIVPQLQGIARRRALEEQTGGIQHALSANLAQKTEQEKKNAELHAAGKIHADQLDWLNRSAMQEYVAKGGVGTKNEQGFYNSYPSITPALAIDGEKVAMETANGWKTDKMQQGALDPITGAYKPTQANIDAIKAKHPYYVDTGRQGLLQTGTLEWATLDEIYETTLNSLSNNEGLIEYLKQEAQFRGGATDEQSIKDYVINKVHNFSLDAANKYSTSHFEPKAYEDWMAKERYKSHLRQKEISMLIPKEKPIKVQESSGTKITYQADPSTFVPEYSTKINDRHKLQIELDKLVASVNGDLTKLTGVKQTMYKQYSDDIANLNIEMEALSKVAEQANDYLSGNGQDLYQTTTGVTLFNLGLDPNNQDLKGKLIWWLRDNYSVDEMTQMLSSGQGKIEGLQQFLMSNDLFKDAVKNASSAEGKATANGYVQGDIILGEFGKNIKRALGEIDFEEEVQYTFYGTESKDNVVGDMQQDLTMHLKTNTVDGYTVTSTGQGFVNVQQYAEEMDLGKVIEGSEQARWSKEVTPSGAHIAYLTFKTEDGKSHSIYLSEKRDVNKNNKEQRYEMGVALIKSGLQLGSIEGGYDEQARGSMLLGTNDWGQPFADSGVYKLQKGKTGEDQRAIVYKDGKSAYQVTWVPSLKGYILSSAEGGYEVNAEDLLHPNSPQRNRLVTNSRPWEDNGKGNQFLFKDLNSLYEELGWRYAAEHINTTADYVKPRAGVGSTPIYYNVTD